MQTVKDMFDNYGTQSYDIQIATLKSSQANVMGFSDGTSVAINKAYFNAKTMDKAYDNSTKSGFHPSRGDKTGIQAVMAHELGHQLTMDVAAKMGIKGGNIDSAAKRIVEDARKEIKARGVVKMAAKISRYATVSNAETVAEAVSDVYCNGNKAKAESIAINNVLRRYLGRS